MRNRSQKLVVAVLFAGLAVLVLLFAGSCGGRSPTPAAAISSSAHQGSSVEDSSFLKEELKRLDELPLPEGVDPKLWASLKERMRNFLTDRYSGKQSSYYQDGWTHYYVVPRELIWESAGDNGKLTWIYVNDGDYDQGGTVGLEDITPLAIHHGEGVTADNTIQELIDEDDEDPNGPNPPPPIYNGDDIVDIEEDDEGDHDDFETIERNYGVVVDHYKILGSTTGGDPWTEVATVDFTDHDPPLEGEDRYRFHWDIPNTDYAYYIVKACNKDGIHYTGEEEGETITMESEICLLPEVTEVEPDPIEGRPGDIVDRIYAKVSGAEPFNYSWDFAGHLIPNTSNEAEVEDGEITGPYADDWDASLTVTNVYGEDTRNIHFIVTEEPVAPDIHRIWMEYEGVEIEAGDPGWEVTFCAEVTGSTPRYYDWDFGGGATPNESSDASPTVILGDARIEAYNGTLAVSNDAGAVLEGFQYSVGRHVDIGDITPLTDGLSGEQKTFQVTFSGTPPIHYEWRFGGGTEPNEFSGSVGEPGEIGPFAVEVDVTLLNGLPYDQHLTAAYDNIPGNEARTYVGSIAAWNDVFNEAMSKPFILRVTSRWHMEDIELVVYDEVTPEDISLDFNSTWNPAISFQRNWWLWFAEHDGVEWSTEPIDEQNHSGHYSSLKFDSLDRPNVSYSAWPGNYQPGILRFARRDDGAWYTQDVDTNATNSVGGYNSLELFPGNRPAISYLDDDDWSLKYAHATAWIPGIGWQWSIETVVEGSDEDSVTGFISLALRNGTEPLITFTDLVGDMSGAFSRIELVERIEGEWQWPRIIEDRDAPGSFAYTSLSLDSTGLPNVAYHRNHEVRDLRFAQLIDGEWDPETVDDEEGGNDKAGLYASLALDGIDRPLIGYHLYRDPQEFELKTAYYLPGVIEDSDWVLDSLPVTQENIEAVSLALDIDDNPAMAYVQKSSAGPYWLKFAHFW